VSAALGYYLGFRVAREKLDYVLGAAGLLVIGVAGLAVAAVLLASFGLWLRLRGGADGGEDIELETGLTGGTSLRLPCFHRWPLLQLHVVWEEPSGIEVTLVRRSGGCDELVRPLERGAAERIRRRFVVGDVFGFARIGIPRSSAAHVRVKPVRARVTAHVTRRFLGGDALSWPSGPAEGEYLEMRRYAYGDPLRHVLWKAFARTRKLLVRTPERAIAPLPSAASYFVAGPSDEPAASVARAFVEEGLLGKELLFSSDGAAEPTRDPAEALEQIIASIRHRHEGGAGLQPFLARLDAERRRNCVLFVPPVPGRWLAEVERTASLVPAAQVMTAVDSGLEGADRNPRWRRWLFDEDDQSTRSYRALGEVVRRLGRAGFEVHVLYRPSGELLGQSQLEALGDRAK
jgi:hypothetical protein